MRCRRVRRLLVADGARPAPVRQHLDGCAACAGFARRLGAAEEALGAHHSRVTPPRGFAAAVAARLPGEDHPLGWAALRLLPAALVLLLLLSWLNLRASEPVAAETDPAEAVLGWVLDPAGEPGAGS